MANIFTGKMKSNPSGELPFQRRLTESLRRVLRCGVLVRGSLFQKGLQPWQGVSVPVGFGKRFLNDLDFGIAPSVQSETLKLMNS